MLSPTYTTLTDGGSSHKKTPLKGLQTWHILTPNKKLFLLQGLPLSSAMISMFYLFSFYTNISSVSVESLQLIGHNFLPVLQLLHSF